VSRPEQSIRPAVEGGPQTDIVGSMIMPLSPDKDGVAAPALLLVGVRVN
jgi:hypothetical protein